MQFKKYLKMKINKKILARTILIILAISYLISVWMLVGKEWVYFLVGLVTVAALISWSAKNA